MGKEGGGDYFTPLPPPRRQEKKNFIVSSDDSDDEFGSLSNVATLKRVRAARPCPASTSSPCVPRVLPSNCTFTQRWVVEELGAGLHPPKCINSSRIRPFRKLILAGNLFGLSRQCLIMHDMETLWSFIYEALPGQFP